MDFNKGLKKRKTITRDGLTKGIVLYNEDNDEFKVQVGDKDYTVNAYQFLNTNIVYSKPDNDKHPNWTKRKVSLENKDRFIQLARYWSTIKPNMKVRGNIIDNRFIIEKY